MTMKQQWTLIVSVVAVCTTAILFFTLGGANHSAQPVSVAELQLDTMRRLSPDQYRHAIADIFGPHIEVDGRFVDTGQRHAGLLEVGSAKVSVTSTGFEEAEQLARKIAQQVISIDNRDDYLPCKPEAETRFDRNCAQQFIGNAGYLLYRRPLLDSELKIQMEVAEKGVEDSQNFYIGLERSLANMLMSPDFLFRMEYMEPDPENSGEYRLDSFSRAARLSYLLWNGAPDLPLLKAAEQGDLHSKKGLQKQVARMLKSPRMERGVRAFFSDMLSLDDFEILTKDRKIYPQFTLQVAADAREQTLRILIDHLLVREADYRELFTSPRTFLTPSLAALLSIPLVQKNTAYSAPDEWVAYSFDEGDPRSGLLAQPGFVALHSHAGRTSPTLRGKALREMLLCQEVPPPPADVDFKLVEDSGNSQFKTMRQRLAAHAEMPTCAGCHKITDPIGLALENFDSDGGYRMTENGEMIDPSGEIDGVAYSDAAGLGKALENNASVVSCLVNRVFSYGAGREVQVDDRKWLRSVRKDFASDDYKFMNLLQIIATSDEFYRSSTSSHGDVLATR